MLNKISDKVLAKAIRSANWQAIKNPGMEYRVTLDEDGIRVTEWLAKSWSWREGEQYLWTACYYPDGCGTPSHEQHALIEKIPEIIKEIREGYEISLH